MGWLARKVSRAKWEPKPEELGPNAIQADAVTSDLRTQGNSLSFWQCLDPNNEDELREVALALAGASERVDKIDIAWIKEDFLRKKGFSIERTEGKTQVVDLRNKHVDLIKLDLQKICSLAKCLCKSIRKEGNFRRFTKGEVLQILREAAQEGRLYVDALPEKIRAELKNLTPASETE